MSDTTYDTAADAARLREQLGGVASVPGVAKPDPIVVADNMVRRFGGLTAVEVEHLEIQRGSITALIGPNGAGKTTFFNCLTGFGDPDEGEWSFDGASMSKAPAHKFPQYGMVRTFQLTKALSKLTVIETPLLACQSKTNEQVLRFERPLGIAPSSDDSFESHAFRSGCFVAAG